MINFSILIQYQFLCRKIQQSQKHLIKLQKCNKVINCICKYIQKQEMFPDISKAKKKQKIGDDEMLKECQTLLKQLETKYKRSIKSIPNEYVSDLNKVCRLKDIESFYSQYFYLFVHKADPDLMSNAFAQQVQNIMLGKSHYQKITAIIKQRNLNISQLKETLSIVEGFSLMNAGKNVPHNMKGTINDLIKECVSLDHVKAIEKAQVERLAADILKVRDNLKQLVQAYQSWEKQLKCFLGNNKVSLQKIKVIFPQNGINCLLIGLYDTQFLKASFLSHSIKFANVEFDPFVLNIQSNKKSGKIIEESLINKLKENADQYKQFQQIILNLNPKIKKQQSQSHRQLKQPKQSKQKIHRESKTSNKASRPNSRDRKRKKVEEGYLNVKMMDESTALKNKIQNVKRLIDIDDIDRIYKNKNKRNNKKKSPNKQSNNSSIQLVQKVKKLNEKSPFKNKSVFLLEQRQVQLSQSSQQSEREKIDRPKSMVNIFQEKRNSKSKNTEIQNIYKLKKKSLSIINASPKVNKVVYNNNQGNSFKRIMDQKKQLAKELEKQKEEQQKLKKIVKKVQSRTQSENRFYQEKMEKYQQEISNLKNRIKDRTEKAQKNVFAKQKQQRNIQNTNLNILKTYKSKKNESSARKKYQSLKNNQSINKAQQDLSSPNKIISEKNSSRLLQLKIKQLNKQRQKLIKITEKQDNKVNKERQIYERKLNKYQQVIQKLKEQSNLNKSVARDLQIKYKNTVDEQRKNSQLNIMKMYTKKSSLAFTLDNKPRKLANNNSINKDAFNSSTVIEPRLSSTSQKRQQRKEVNRIKEQNNKQSSSIQKITEKPQKQKRDQNLRIINNKNTIQIVYNPKRKKKSSDKQSQNDSLLRQKDRQYQLQMIKLEKQKQLLQRKLDIKSSSRSGIQASLLKKLDQKQDQLEKYKQLIEKQKNSQRKYQERMKQMKMKMNEEYEDKLVRERAKHQRQKEHLFLKLKAEKQTKIQKEKYLSKQMIFLKEMQMRENELIDILERQRKQKAIREQQLEEQLTRKQEILQTYEIQQIKKAIQEQVRAEMNLQYQAERDYDEDSSSSPDLQQRKKQIQKQIAQLINSNDSQLGQIDEQNQRLKKLIQKIKEQERRVIEHLENDIENTQQEENSQSGSKQSKLEENGASENEQSHNINENVKLKKSSKLLERSASFEQSRISQNRHLISQGQKQESEFQKNQSLLKELKMKTQLQIEKQKNQSSRIKQLQTSPTYKERQKIQNIIEHYLKDPYRYPSNKSVSLKSQQKNNLIQDLVSKNKRAQQFQQQLMRVKNVQKFVPAQRDDVLTSHMLNLREVYENQQAQSLRRVLFPPINEQERFNFGQNNDLSFESESTEPPITMMDHIKVHQKNYQQVNKSKEKKNKGKNFLSINRVKLMQIEEERREKQRQLIQEQSKHKIRKFNSKHKKNMLTIEQQIKASKQAIKTKIQVPEKAVTNKQKQEIKQNQSIQKEEHLKYGNKQVYSKQNEGFQFLQAQNEFLMENKQQQQKKNQQKIQIDSQKFVGSRQPKQILEDNQDQSRIQINKNQRYQEYQNKNESIKEQQQQNGISQKKSDIEKINFQQEQEEYEDDFNQFLTDSNIKKSGQMQLQNRQTGKQDTQRQIKQGKQQQVQQLQSNYVTSQNIALLILEKQKSNLKSDVMSYQDSIRSYIEAEARFQIYQHHEPEQGMQTYIKQLMELSSQQVISLNNNDTLIQDIKQFETFVILIAKDEDTGLQIGIGLFHKQYQLGEYVCDFLVSHNMRNFLNLTFNFSRYIHQVDKYTHHVQYIFTMDALKDQVSQLHFNEFEARCKRLGQVYVKARGESKTRKYVLRRNLFDGGNYTPDKQMQQKLGLDEGKGVQFSNKVQLHQNLMKQRNQGFINKFHSNHGSSTILLSQYLSNNKAELQKFKNKTEGDLSNRQIIITAMVFQKKQFTIKNIQSYSMDTQRKLQLYKDILFDKFTIQDVQQQVQQLSIKLEEIAPPKTKRCFLEMNGKPEPYCLMQFPQALNQAQASNSSQIGTFLPIIPKYKVLVISAEEFLTSCTNNPDINVYFYVKHFFKNITQIKKENFERVYIPEINIDSWTFYKDISTKLEKTVFGRQKAQLGWKSKLNNSIIFTPSHKDLVFEKPFIISIFSANIERAIQGSPIFCKVIF